MKRMLIAVMAILALSIIGCEEETTRYIEIDVEPAIPQGVFSITGDGEVYIGWLPVQDADLSHYRVWWSTDDSTFEFMATSDDNYYVDTDVDNGSTYFYAVSAVDNAGNESDLSVESVYDTPRPDGRGIYIEDYNQDPNNAGFDFSAQSTVRYDNVNADIFCEYDNVLGVFFLNVANINTDIQDMGFTYDFDEIGYSPDSGWSDVGWLEVIEGHTYIIWTADNHFAKIRPYGVIGNDGILIEWAYQTDVGNPELARPQHDEDFLVRTIEGTILK